MEIKQINKLQVVIKNAIWNIVFCEGCMRELGYSQNESHDANLRCGDCL